MQLLDTALMQVRREAARLGAAGCWSGREAAARWRSTFAWGVRIGRQLTGRLFDLEMIAGEDLGYTRLRENKLFISPMPLLRGQQNARGGRRGADPARVRPPPLPQGRRGAKRSGSGADKEQLPRLLNLVSDEHLERNLRALRRRRSATTLKMLGGVRLPAHGPRGAGRDAADGLQRRAFAVLSRRSCGRARSARLRGGQQRRGSCSEMERAGMSFARFVRALRMGLGNRHGDPKVAAGLELFKGPASATRRWSGCWTSPASCARSSARRRTC